MTGRFCYLAERQFVSKQFSRVFETLQSAGITLANPGSGAISCLTDEGDQVEAGQTDIVGAIKASSPITFQVWLSEDTDVVCSFYTLADSLFVQKYNLDGLTAKERAVMAEWAVDYFAERSKQRGMLLLVVDSEGTTAEFDWDGFVEGRCGPPALQPEIVGVCSPLEIAWGGSVVQSNDCRLVTNRTSKGRQRGM